MARTLSCADVGYKCAYQITTEDGNDNFIIDTTIKHAESHHPELMENEPVLREKLRAQIRELLDQSGYHKATSE
jgi:predicted small metal-binding protein